jgi:hypothetical protein
MLQAGRSWVRVPMRWIFFQFTYSFQPHDGPGSIQPLTEMNTRNLHGGVKGGRARKADKFTAICEPII